MIDGIDAKIEHLKKVLEEEDHLFVKMLIIDKIRELESKKVFTFGLDGGD